MFTLPSYTDGRGTLTVANAACGGALPFQVERVFWITQVPAGASRGRHAHRTSWEALVAVAGAFSVRLSDGLGNERVFALNTPGQGLYVPPMVWCDLHGFSPDAVCLCMASGAYDKEGYISDYDAFCQAASADGHSPLAMQNGESKDE